MRHLDGLFLINGYNRLKFRSYLQETAGLRVPIRNHGDLTLFNNDSKRHIRPSTRCPLVANAVSKDSGIFNGRSISSNELQN